MKRVIHTLKSFIGLSKKIYKDNWRYVFCTIFVCTIVFLGDALFIPLINQNIFDILEQNDLYLLCRRCGLFMLVLLIVLGAATVLYLFSNAWFDLIANRSTSKLFELVFKMPYEEVKHTYDDGELFNRIVSGSRETISVFAAGTQYLDTLLSTIIFFIIFYSISSSYVIIGLCVIISMIIRTLIEIKLNNYYEKKIAENSSKRAKNLKFLMDNLEQLEMNRLTNYALNQWKESRNYVWKNIFRKACAKSILDILTDLIFSFGQCAVYSTLNNMNRYASLPTGILTSSTTYFDYFKNNLNICEDCASWLPSYFVPIERMTTLIDEGSSIKSNWSLHNEPYSSSIVEIHNLSVRFDNKNILNNLSLSIIKGEKVAIIGYNGAGKSTLIKAILGQFAVSTGFIEIHTNNLQHTMSYIPVSTQMFSMTAYKNIALGTNEENPNLPDLPFGNNNATKLSGGQQQQVNIYRALINKSDLLIADEATSALDIGLRNFYLDEILSSSSSLIFITHDKNILNRFDRIILLQNGKIVTDGNYSHVSSTPCFQKWSGDLD